MQSNPVVIKSVQVCQKCSCSRKLLSFYYCSNCYCFRARGIVSVLFVRFNKLMSLFHGSALLSTMNFVSLQIHSAIALWIHIYFDNVMIKFIFNNRTDAWNTDVNLFLQYQIVKLSALAPWPITQIITSCVCLLIDHNNYANEHVRISSVIVKC